MGNLRPVPDPDPRPLINASETRCICRIVDAPHGVGIWQYAARIQRAEAAQVKSKPVINRGLERVPGCGQRRIYEAEGGVFTSEYPTELRCGGLPRCMCESAYMSMIVIRHYWQRMGMFEY